MASLRITGNQPLNGTIAIAGSKNAMLPLLAAAILTPGKTTFTNRPRIDDVITLEEMTSNLGVNIAVNGRSVVIDSPNIIKATLDADQMKRLRASLLLLAPLLVRHGRATLPFPGGDLIGRRPLTTHIQLLSDLGFEVKALSDRLTVVKRHRSKNRIYLREQSVTASELALLLGPSADTTISLIGLAIEPHVTFLGNYLNLRGAKIHHLGSSEVIITPHRLSSSPINVAVPPDPIEVMTFLAAFLATGGEGEITNILPHELDAVLAALENMSAKFSISKNRLHVFPSQLTATNIQVRPYPGIPTDTGPLFTILATQATGQTMIHDWMFERRFGYTDDLLTMGAHITLCDPHRILVHGPTQLSGRRIFSPDIRAGSSLLIAALAAVGDSIIDNVELIDRGYENITERLGSLGALIQPQPAKQSIRSV